MNSELKHVAEELINSDAEQQALREAVANSTDVVPHQTEMPFAIVEGEPVTELPKDLYIPPDALQVFLEAFEGPLDLLLYLIRKQNLDILDIPIAEITRQYMRYIDVMQNMQLELAGEYLLMAAMLAEIKSRMLLPRAKTEEGQEEDDPRAELVRRLQEYERYKQAADNLDRLHRMERDVLPASAELVERKVVKVPPQISMREMLLALREVIQRSEHFIHHHIRREPLSIRQRMTDVLGRLENVEFIDFVALFDPEEGRMGVTVTFVAVLELMKVGMIDIVQAEPYAPIHVRKGAGNKADLQNDAADAENEAALAQPELPDDEDEEPVVDVAAELHLPEVTVPEITVAEITDRPLTTSDSDTADEPQTDTADALLAANNTDGKPDERN